MAGRPRGAEARNAEIKVRVTPAGKRAAIEAARPLSVSDWLRHLMAKDMRERGL